VNGAVESALNEQIKQEFASAYTYLAMAAYCRQQNLPGAAHWLEVQAKEELDHAMRIYSFIHDRGGRVALQAIPQPPDSFASVVNVFEQVLQHEQSITAGIHKLYALATSAPDYPSIPFLQRFITEQVEEEKQAADVLAMAKLVAQSPQGVLLMDRELAKR
jgi:ferritin